jgi:peptidoglycan/LPS O-acetylase OafA/YrhL
MEQPFISLHERYSWASAFEFAFLQVPWIHHGTWNRPSWSLSADWHAYIAFFP